ncbi:hypothetical protein [Sinisalibacter lacisalsi]|uniref:Uncharacterized protein n=1 Tax=Sinisalibacter lacisalsi TaxID=1526570 RepID=A0ABQ1QA71_9RHOB|nr:hypothetical protein [Sinisalibacter lacisalsi]GGD19906.1 hypothetical protein GCM10011358_00640 [Sinisalibacter lacisalsi]
MAFIFTKSITRTAIVTALSASLALTPVSVTPARAGEAELGAVAAASFFALVTAGIIASAAKENSGGSVIDRHPPARHPGRGPQRPDPRKTIPAQCDLYVQGGPDRGVYYTRSCLMRNFDYWAFLPDRCEERVWVPRLRQNVNAYDAQCLARFGYKEAQSRPRSVRR